MKRETVDSIVDNLKKNITREFRNGRYNSMLELMSVCASILYETNVSYCDPFLEENLQEVAQRIKDTYSLTCHLDHADDNAVIFYDGFGMDNRGLAKIYLRALGTSKKVFYITHANRKPYIPEILQMVESSGGNAFFLERGTKIAKILQLHEYICSTQAKQFLLYTYPDDTVATTLLYAFDNSLNRYRINLTDHAFWLGTECTDRCIEFRDYGASISAEYRNIPQKKITMLPFYPSIDYEQSFLGFPFPLEAGQKVIFSGGSLYKTLGEDNQYYKIVDYILSNFKDTVFWYAGSGDDSEILKCCARYPGRVFLTSERPDLYQVLKNCYFFLNTYPVSGGLMYQYSACAGRIPVTLRFDDDNDGMLINQKELRVDFDTPEELYQEIRQLLEDENYYQNRCLKMLESVITEDRFAVELNAILSTGSSMLPVHFRPVETTRFRERALQIQTEDNMNRLFFRKSAVVAMLRYHPIRFASGVIQVLKERFC